MRDDRECSPCSLLSSEEAMHDDTVLHYKLFCIVHTLNVLWHAFIALTLVRNSTTTPRC